MRRRTVEFSQDAKNDLLALYEQIAEASSPTIALNYIERIEEYCRGFEVASERGHLRDDIREGLRITGFEKRVAIAFIVEDDRVVILRLFYGGRNWPEMFEA